MPEQTLNPTRWTAKFPAKLGHCGRETVGWNSAPGDHLELDRGYSISRNLKGTAAKAGGYFTHMHTDETINRWFYHNTNLYEDDGTSTPSSIASGLTESFRFADYNMNDPTGTSGFFNGTNSQAQIIRRSGADLVSAAHEIIQVADAGATGAATGSIADDTYYVRVCVYDKGGTVAVFGEPSPVDTIVLNGGGNGQIDIAEPANANGRGTGFRYAIATTDSPSSYLMWADVDFTGGDDSVTLTTLPATQTSQAFTDINNIYRQAHMPITGVDICTIWEGRLFIASSTQGKVAWSERSNPNHWYTDQVFDADGEGAFGGVIRGLSWVGGTIFVFTTDSIFVIYGDLRRDDDPNDSLATFKIRVEDEPFDAGIGCVSPQSIVKIGGKVFFWSTQGPAVIAGGGVKLLLQDDIRPWISKHLDTDHLGRIVGAEDPDLHMMTWIVPRGTNASRPHDGASVAGICDYWIRWDLNHGHWCPPRQLDAVHITHRTDAADGGTPAKTYLMATGPYGAFLRMNDAPSGGGATDAATSTDYDGKLASSSTTTSVTFTLAGVSNDAFDGFTVLLRNHNDDDVTGPRYIQKTVKNTSVSGSAVTVSWDGAITAPSGTERTVRIAGLRQAVHLPHSVHDLGIPADKRGQVQGPIEVWFRDKVGQEAIA